MKTYRIAVLLLLAGCFLQTDARAAVDWPALTLSTPISGINFPTHIANAGDGSGRLFVVEVGGKIRLIKNGVLQTTPFLDMSARQSQGLFSVAFAPDYATSGYFYVNYIDLDLNVAVARYKVSSNPDIADLNSEHIILKVASPWAVSIYSTAGHAGGELAFGPNDGYLYLGIGDGDPGNRDDENTEGDFYNLGQDPQSLRGKMLRLDVSGDDFPTDANRNYRIPASNPFANSATTLPEIWAIGVRNPWRSSFDRQTGDFYIGDVGQDLWEEVDFQPGNSTGGENYGWKLMEGNHCYRSATCNQTGLTLPIHEYAHDNQQLGSVTGGRVYRGLTYPRMKGIYFYGDYNFGKIWGLVRDNGVWQNQLLIDDPTLIYGIIGFGEDEAGNVWVTNASNGSIYRLTDSTVNTAPTADALTFTTQQGAATAISVTATDVENDTLTYSVVATPTNGTLSGTGPNFSYTSNANYDGPDSFTFKVNDGEFDSNTATVTINVNAPPTISEISDRSIYQNTSTGAIAFTIGDSSTPAASLTLSKLSSNTTLVPLAKIVFGGSGSNRTATVTPATGQVGQTTITLTVTVTNGGSRSETFVLTVIATYTVSGRASSASGVGIANVSVSSGVGAPVLTNGAGYFTFPALPTGSYTLMPTLANYTFAPVSRGVTVVNANVANQNFIGRTGIKVSGRISDSKGVQVAGVSLLRTGSTTPVVSNGAGYYTFIDVPPGNITITPSRNGYRFTPTTRTVTAGATDISNLNFIGATGRNISGRVANSSGIGQAGISVRRTGSNVAAITNGAGYYTFTDVPDGEITITATGAGLSFAPENRTVTVSGADLAGYNFTSAPGFNLIGRLATSAGIAVANVRVTRTGSAIAVFSNNAGYYVFANTPNGTYVVTPQLNGVTFTPATRTATVNGGDALGQNFIASGVP